MPENSLIASFHRNHSVSLKDCKPRWWSACFNWTISFTFPYNFSFCFITLHLCWRLSSVLQPAQDKKRNCSSWAHPWVAVALSGLGRGLAWASCHSRSLQMCWGGLQSRHQHDDLLTPPAGGLGVARGLSDTEGGHHAALHHRGGRHQPGLPLRQWGRGDLLSQVVQGRQGDIQVPALTERPPCLRLQPARSPDIGGVTELAISHSLHFSGTEQQQQDPPGQHEHRHQREVSDHQEEHRVCGDQVQVRGQHRGSDVLHWEQVRRPAGRLSAGLPSSHPRSEVPLRPGRLPAPQLLLLRVQASCWPHLVRQWQEGNTSDFSQWKRSFSSLRPTVVTSYLTPSASTPTRGCTPRGRSCSSASQPRTSTRPASWVWGARPPSATTRRTRWECEALLQYYNNAMESNLRDVYE